MTAKAVLKKAVKSAAKEKWELHLLRDIRALRLPDAVREHQFHALRKWRFDFAWPSLRVACEVDGGIWMDGGAHSLPSNIERDIEKGNAAVMDGWQVLRFTPQMVQSGAAVRLLEKLLNA